MKEKIKKLKEKLGGKKPDTANMPKGGMKPGAAKHKVKSKMPY